MRKPAQRNMPQERRAGCAASRGKEPLPYSIVYVRMPVQREYATGVAHRRRGEYGKITLPYSIVHGAVRK